MPNQNLIKPTVASSNICVDNTWGYKKKILAGCLGTWTLGTKLYIPSAIGTQMNLVLLLSLNIRAVLKTAAILPLNFGMVSDQILVKKKDPPECPWILVWSMTKFWWKKNTLCRNSRPAASRESTQLLQTQKPRSL